MTWMAKIPVLGVKPVSRLRRRIEADEDYVICPVCDGRKRVVLYTGKRWEEKRVCIACEETGQISYLKIELNSEESKEDVINRKV